VLVQYFTVVEGKTNLVFLPVFVTRFFLRSNAPPVCKVVSSPPTVWIMSPTVPANIIFPIMEKPVCPQWPLWSNTLIKNNQQFCYYTIAVCI